MNEQMSINLSWKPVLLTTLIENTTTVLIILLCILLKGEQRSWLILVSLKPSSTQTSYFYTIGPEDIIKHHFCGSQNWKHYFCNHLSEAKNLNCVTINRHHFVKNIQFQHFISVSSKSADLTAIKASNKFLNKTRLFLLGLASSVCCYILK